MRVQKFMQEGLHVLMDREHFKAQTVGKRSAALLAYLEQTRSGEDPMRVAGLLIIKEYRS